MTDPNEVEALAQWLDGLGKQYDDMSEAPDAAAMIRTLAAERDAAVADCQHWRNDYTELQGKHNTQSAAPKGKTVRKIIQIFETPDGFMGALADDGSAWWWSNSLNEWRELFGPLPHPAALDAAP